jgi:hypothetical protein
MAVLGLNNLTGTVPGTAIKWWACKFQAIEDGTFIDLNFIGSSTGSSQLYKLCIWADNAGSPGTLLFESAAGAINTTDQTWTRPCTYAFSNGDIMHLGFVSDDWSNIYNITGATNQSTEFNEDYTSYGSFPIPVTTLAQYSLTTVIWGNYTPSSPVSAASITGIQSIKGIQTLKF